MDQAFLLLGNLDVCRAGSGHTTFNFLPAIHTATQRGFLTPYRLQDLHPADLYERGYRWVILNIIIKY